MFHAFTATGVQAEGGVKANDSSVTAGPSLRECCKGMSLLLAADGA